MRKRPRPKLQLSRESILHLDSAALQGAAGGLLTLQVACPTHQVTCITCYGTCTC